MLVVDLNKANLAYDVHSLVKAFYEAENVKVLTEETAPEKRNSMEEPSIYITVTDTVTQMLLKENALSKKGEEMQYLWQYSKEEGQAPGFKNGFKAFLYQSFSQALGKQLPWVTFRPISKLVRLVPSCTSRIILRKELQL